MDKWITLEKDDHMWLTESDDDENRIDRLETLVDDLNLISRKQKRRLHLIYTDGRDEVKQIVNRLDGVDARLDGIIHQLKLNNTRANKANTAFFAHLDVISVRLTVFDDRLNGLEDRVDGRFKEFKNQIDNHNARLHNAVTMFHDRLVRLDDRIDKMYSRMDDLISHLGSQCKK